MFILSRREAFAVYCVGLISLAAGHPAEGADNKEPLTPDVIVAKKFAGKATIAFVVGEVGVMLTSRSLFIDESEPLHITPQAVGKKASSMYVLMSWEAATRLKRLGIENPAEHFRGKVVRVSGSVERSEGKSGTEYVMQVTNLDQFEEIRAATPADTPKAGFIQVKVIGSFMPKVSNGTNVEAASIYAAEGEMVIAVDECSKAVREKMNQFEGRITKELPVSGSRRVSVPPVWVQMTGRLEFLKSDSKGKNAYLAKWWGKSEGWVLIADTMTEVKPPRD